VTDAPVWDLLLRGLVAGVLLFHVVHLLLPGPRPATRAALAVFSLALIAYLFCQRMALLVLVPRPLIWVVVALCTSGTAWLWLSARALFDDDFGWGWPWLVAGAGMVALGLIANAPRLAAMLATGVDPGPSALTTVHALAMLGFTAAAVWEVLRGWSDDLVEPRRAARRWVALAIGAYAAVALIVELAVRDRPVGLLLPALHVLGIGLIAMVLALVIARRSLAAILGLPEQRPDAAHELEQLRTVAPVPAPTTTRDTAAVPDAAPPTGAATAAEPTAMNATAPAASTATTRPAEAPPPTAMATPPLESPKPSAALQRLERAMAVTRAYKREGLTVAALAADLGMGEAALRALINQQLGYRNFNDFLHHHRLQEAAARLVREDLPILSIALDCGYGSIGPFNRAFRQRYGMTPTEYRAGTRLAQARTPD
jgi:AraC-like DNA-binding protein